MILLTSTSDILTLQTSSTAEVDVHASFLDYNGTLATPGRNNTIVSSATTSTIVGSPGASAQRNVKTLVLRNADAVSTNTVTVSHFDGTHTVSLVSYTLQPGDELQYFDGAGWFVLLANGALKTSITFAPVPSTATSQGTAGQLSFDANFFYVCVAANTWKRVAIASW